MPENVFTADPTVTAERAVTVLQRLGLHLAPAQEDYLIAGVILFAFLLVTLLARVVFRLVLRRLATRTASTLDDGLLSALEPPVLLFILATGVMTALVSLEAFAARSALITRLYGAVVLVLGIAAALRAVHLVIDWYVRRMSQQIGTSAQHYGGLTRKVLSVVIWAVGAVLVLGQLGVEVTPLVTTLGLGSLAVALALQDTLANFFAGIYLMLDRPIKVGDYVRLDTGDEGFVDAIGWRSTHIRLWSNYVVVIPNTRLTSSVITNLVLNRSETAVYINGGVGYLNDLDHVERVLTEVANDVTARVEGAVKDAEPLVRFQEFGDSNVTFLVILKVREFSYQYVLKHEFIKATFRRFKDEGIEISWPVRQLVAPRPIPVTLAPEESLGGVGDVRVPAERDGAV